MKGIILDNGKLKVLNKSLVVGDSEMQEVAIILSLNQGEHKFNPLMGPNLVQLLKSKASSFNIENRVRVALALDNKDYDALKNKIKTLIR
jgi:phage baseplate assembly protein W